MFYRREQGEDRIPRGHRFELRSGGRGRGWALSWRWSGVYDRRRRFHCLCHTLAFARHLLHKKVHKGDLIPKATAQLTLLFPIKYFSQTMTLAKTELLSRMSRCCDSIYSIHFRRETQVGAYNVKLYPRRPKWVNVIAYPLLAGSLFRPGRLIPIVVVLAGGSNPDDGLFATPPLDAPESSDCAKINNSNGIG